MPRQASSAHDRMVQRAIRALDGVDQGLDSADLGERLGVSRPTVARVVDDLRDRRWLIETEMDAQSGTGAGRRSRRWQLSPMAGYAVAIHIGHTTVRTSVSGSSGTVLSDARVTAVDAADEGLSLLGVAMELVAGCLIRAAVEPGLVRGIGLGVPAPVERASRCAASIFLPLWAQTDLAKETSRIFAKRFEGPRPAVFVENEATASARGALARGYAGDSRDFLFLKVSAGIGAGLVLDGRVFSGSEGRAGEFGHLPSPGSSVPPRTCNRCGRVGCLETEASATAILARLADSDPSYPAALQISEVIAHAQLEASDHPRCHASIVGAGRSIGAVLAQVVGFLDVDTVLIGGVMAAAGDLLLDPIREEVRATALPFARPKIVALEREARATIGLAGLTALVLRNTQPLIGV